MVWRRYVLIGTYACSDLNDSVRACSSIYGPSTDLYRSPRSGHTSSGSYQDLTDGETTDRETFTS